MTLSKQDLYMVLRRCCLGIRHAIIITTYCQQLNYRIWIYWSTGASSFYIITLCWYCLSMAVAAAVGELTGIATLVGQIYQSIGSHLVNKDTLQALLGIYQFRLETDAPFIDRGLRLPDCQPYAVNLYDEFLTLGKWLAAKHIRLRNAQGNLFTRRRWKFPSTFTGQKKDAFQYLLGRVQSASDKLIDCVQNSGHVSSVSYASQS